MTERRVISHSEVDTLNQCEYKHKYAHTDKLETLNHSSNLLLGTAGHKFLETFLQAKKDQFSDEEASDLSVGATMDLDMAIPAMALGLKWVEEVWPNLNWKPVMMEQEYRVTITDTLVY